MSIDYATQDGTALAGSDYVAASGTLKFAPGETAKTVKVLLINDTIHENAETFSLKLSNLVGATTLDPVGIVHHRRQRCARDRTLPSILWRNASTGGVELWSPNGSGGFTYDNPGHSQHELANPGDGRFHRERRKRHSVAQRLDRRRRVQELAMAQRLHYQDPGLVNTSLAGRRNRRFTGDGADSVLWRNASTGGVELWNPNGSGGFTYQSLERLSTRAGRSQEPEILPEPATTASSGATLPLEASSFGTRTDRAASPIEALNARQHELAGRGNRRFHRQRRGRHPVAQRLDRRRRAVEPERLRRLHLRSLAPVNTNWQVAGTGDYHGKRS